MIATRRARLPLLVIGLLLVARAAAAQAAPALQVSAGYTYLNDPTAGLTFRSGWHIGVARGVTDWLSLAASYDDSRRTVPTIAGDLSFGVRTVLAGAQASARLGRLIEFGQVLAGLAHTSGVAFGVSEGGTYGAVQAGAGVDYPFLRRVSLRIELDYRAFFDRSANRGHQIRGLAGLAVTIR